MSVWLPHFLTHAVRKKRRFNRIVLTSRQNASLTVCALCAYSTLPQIRSTHQQQCSSVFVKCLDVSETGRWQMLCKRMRWLPKEPYTQPFVVAIERVLLAVLYIYTKTHDADIQNALAKERTYMQSGCVSACMAEQTKRAKANRAREKNERRRKKCTYKATKRPCSLNTIYVDNNCAHKKNDCIDART